MKTRLCCAADLTSPRVALPNLIKFVTSSRDKYVPVRLRLQKALHYFATYVHHAPLVPLLFIAFSSTPLPQLRVGLYAVTDRTCFASVSPNHMYALGIFCQYHDARTFDIPGNPLHESRCNSGCHHDKDITAPTRLPMFKTLPAIPESVQGISIALAHTETSSNISCGWAAAAPAHYPPRKRAPPLLSVSAICHSQRELVPTNRHSVHRTPRRGIPLFARSRDSGLWPLKSTPRLIPDARKSDPFGLGLCSG